MFTGIVEEIGEVVGIEHLPDEAIRLSIAGRLVTSDLHHGDSVSTSGVCLTAVDIADGVFTADVMRETLVRSSLGSAQVGSHVNLERAVTLATRLGGHLVQGHVDGTGVILSREPSQHWELVRISLPDDLARYVVEKGSIAVDGISLTVARLAPPDEVHAGESFIVSLIPTTLQMTTLGPAAVGTHVNLEVDIMAKYAERLWSFARSGSSS